MELATDPPEIVSSILRFPSNFLNYGSSINFILLFAKLFLIRNSSSTLQITSTIALPIPVIFIQAFFVIIDFFLFG
jgi:hypothetical protein